MRRIAIWMFVRWLLSCSLIFAGQSEITSEKLLHSTASWDGMQYPPYSKGQPELSVLKIVIPPHTAMKWHSHLVPNAAYVLSGQITVEKYHGETKHFTQGQVIPETEGALHRGVTGDDPVTLIVFYAGLKGTPLSVPAPSSVR